MTTPVITSPAPTTTTESAPPSYPKELVPTIIPYLIHTLINNGTCLLEDPTVAHRCRLEFERHHGPICFYHTSPLLQTPTIHPRVLGLRLRHAVQRGSGLGWEHKPCSTPCAPGPSGDGSGDDADVSISMTGEGDRRCAGGRIWKFESAWSRESITRRENVTRWEYEKTEGMQGRCCSAHSTKRPAAPPRPALPRRPSTGEGPTIPPLPPWCCCSTMPLASPHAVATLVDTTRSMALPRYLQREITCPCEASNSYVVCAPHLSLVEQRVSSNSWNRMTKAAAIVDNDAVEVVVSGTSEPEVTDEERIEFEDTMAHSMAGILAWEGFPSGGEWRTWSHSYYGPDYYAGPTEWWPGQSSL